MGSEAESFSGIPPPIVAIILYEKHYFDALVWEQCLALKHRFAMERQFLSGACSKENDGVIRRFMTSEHANLRYVVLHGNRYHICLG